MSEWIKWEGKGEAPTGMVFVRLSDGDESKDPYDAGKFYWDHDNSPSDIAAYKLATSAVDMVNNPPHYKQGAVECIDAIRAALTEQAEVHAMELKVYGHMNQHLAREVEQRDEKIVELTLMLKKTEELVTPRDYLERLTERVWQLESDSLMADCMTQTRLDLIEAGIISENVPPMMLSNAVVARIRELEAEIHEFQSALAIADNEENPCAS